MTKHQSNLAGKTVQLIFDGNFSAIDELVGEKKAIFVTDTNVYKHHAAIFEKRRTIIIEAGEQYKQQAAIDKIISALVEMEADRTSYLVGVGGGVVTDIAGYAASVYMRGISFGFVPTSILAMVDAAIGGKNGIDHGLYKNLIGSINQPDFLLYDYTLLATLPQQEWVNGFAEIIKHACIKDETMFIELQQNSIAHYQKDNSALDVLIQRNAQLKLSVVVNDPFEKAERKLLNFGHTFGHAIENTYAVAHGQAISLGMVIAAKLSEEMNGFNSDQKEQLVALLEQYQLMTSMAWDKEKVFSILKMDKKRMGESIHFVLLNKIGNACYKEIPLVQLEDFIQQNL